MLGRGSVLELAEVINTASLEILSHGYRQLLRYVVFAYGERQGAQPSVFLVFNYRAGQWYPLVPAPRPGDFKRAEREVEGVFRVERDVELERELHAKLAGALPIVNAPNDWFQFQNAPF